MLLVIALVVVAVWAWYLLGRQVAARTKPELRRMRRLSVIVSSAVGVANLVLGVVFFVLTGYDWLVLAAIWAVGWFQLGMLGLKLRLARRTTGKTGAA